MTSSEKRAALDELAKQIINCKNCGLCETAINAVPGEGNADSEIVFIGEAPGATEDQTGRPFVGRAGKLLEFMLGQIGYKREDIWIGNIIKHRPPDNRDPMPEEIKACQPFLTRQLEIINPKIIVTLGRFAMNYFALDAKISLDHGKPLEIKSHIVYPVYHPAAGLRNPKMKLALIEDFLEIPKILKEAKEK